jgi:hypothetical protein
MLFSYEHNGVVFVMTFHLRAYCFLLIKLCSSPFEHCLHLILPPVKTSQYYMCERSREHLLPDYRTVSHKVISSVPFISKCVIVSTLCVLFLVRSF